MIEARGTARDVTNRTYRTCNTAHIYATHSGMEDPLVFNIVDASGRLLCPSCGYPGYATTPAYAPDGGLIGTAICPCCLWEPGFDDVQSASGDAKNSILSSLRVYRSKWSSLQAWQGKPELQPNNWNGATQLENLFRLAPHVR